MKERKSVGFQLILISFSSLYTCGTLCYSDFLTFSFIVLVKSRFMNCTFESCSETFHSLNERRFERYIFLIYIYNNPEKFLMMCNVILEKLRESRDCVNSINNWSLVLEFCRSIPSESSLIRRNRVHWCRDTQVP